MTPIMAPYRNDKPSVLKHVLMLSAGLSLCMGLSHAQPFASWEGNRLVLDNGLLQRYIDYEPGEGSFSTTSLKLHNGGESYLSEHSEEFRFTLNGNMVNGNSTWQCSGMLPATDDYRGSGATVRLVGSEGPARGLTVEITYLLYPKLPVIRKYITLINNSESDLRIENLDVEHLEIQGNLVHRWLRDENSWLLTNYCRHRTIGPYKGSHVDPVIVVHDILRSRGMALGNEAPGVMKRTGVFLDGKSATIGLTRSDEDYPFRKWLKPGESWESPRTFLALYENSPDPFCVIDGPVNDFVREHMGIRLAELDRKPAFVYNTWNPFRTELSDSLVLDVARAAAACGVEEFIIDAGWSTNYGDWEIDPVKFPGGLKPVFDSIKSLGMKPGLWISMAGAASDSKVFREHPEWFIQDAAGRYINLHQPFGGMKTACMGTGWSGHFKSTVLDLVHDHGLEYAKLDFAIVTSAYRYDPEISGCHAKHHPFHRDWPESHLSLYRRAWELFDALHREAPGLFIDCTFETMGALQLIDYDMCKHAEGNWLSNIEEPGPLGALRARHLAWWRSPVIPAGTLVIGNLAIDDPEVELHLMSLAGAFPIMLGDPRKVPLEKRKRLGQWSAWLRAMQARHDYMMYRQDLMGYGEPGEGRWDGFQRINTKTGSGGILGIFRQGSKDEQRQVYLKYLEPGADYALYAGPGGEHLGTYTGRELMEKGFTVTLVKEYGGALFEIRRQ
jgi:alpha-galactosidase